MNDTEWSDAFDFLRREGFDPLMTGRVEALEQELALLQTHNICLRAALRAIRGRLRDTSSLHLIDRVLKENG